MAVSPATAADGYPSQPITLVVPYPPGGTADNLARILAKGMSDRLRQAPEVRRISSASCCSMRSAARLSIFLTGEALPLSRI